jgi:hypothetical protein
VPETAEEVKGKAGSKLLRLKSSNWIEIVLEIRYREF